MKVYLVEDSPGIRHWIRTTVEESGGIVVGEAATEDAAVVGLLAGSPDMAVVDLRLAQGSGVEVVRKVKRERPELIVVVLTNHFDDGYRQACMDAGADFFLDKTCEFGRLASLMETLIRVLG